MNPTPNCRQNIRCKYWYWIHLGSCTSMEQLFDIFNNLKFHKFEILDTKEPLVPVSWKFPESKKLQFQFLFILPEHQNKFFDSQICDWLNTWTSQKRSSKGWWEKLHRLRKSWEHETTSPPTLQLQLARHWVSFNCAGFHSSCMSAKSNH